MQKSELVRWRTRKGALDTRLAALMREVERRAESAYDAYFNRLEVLLTHDDYERLLSTWADGHLAPPDIAAQMDADPETVRLHRESARPLLFLEGTERGAIVSEHFIYQQTGGKLTGPNGEK